MGVLVYQMRRYILPSSDRRVIIYHQKGYILLSSDEVSLFITWGDILLSSDGRIIIIDWNDLKSLLMKWVGGGVKICF